MKMTDMRELSIRRMKLDKQLQDFLTQGTLMGVITEDMNRSMIDVIMRDYNGNSMAWLNKFIGGFYQHNLLSKHKVISNCLDRALLLDLTAGQFYAELVVDMNIAKGD